MRFRCVIMCLLVAAICFASCKRMELHRATSSVYLDIVTDSDPSLPLPEGVDISSSPKLYEKAYGPEVEMYRVCIYDLENHKFAGEDYLPPEGGFLSLPSGIYDMIIYNAGSDVTILEDEQMRSGTYVYTNSSQGDEGLLIPEPDHMFVAVIPEVKIPVYSDADTIRTMTVKTSRIAETYYLEFQNMVGLEKVVSAEVWVSGQVPGKYVWDNRTKDLTGSVSFDPIIDEDKGRIYALFNTFGRNQYRYTEVFVILTITDHNGRQFRWKVDVSEILDNPDNTRNEILIENEIVIPDTDDGGGMTPGVDDWDEDVTVVPIS